MKLRTTSLAGKRALVTGAQQGIGAAIVKALAAAGADVAINWLDDAKAAERLATDVRQSGRRAATMQGNIGRRQEAYRVVDEAVDQLGGLEILVNNAGVFPRSDFLELAEAEWDEVLDVNLKGSFLVAQAAATCMISSQAHGAIVNVSSSAVRGHPRGVHYSASKAGVIGLTRAMALALAAHKIRVNAVAPGLTDTAQPRNEFSEDELQDVGRDIPLGTLAQPDEIADVVVFLASDASRFMTGEVVHANGGTYMA